VDPHRAQSALGEVVDLIARGRSFPGYEVQLVIAVEMHLIATVAKLLALQQFLDNVWIARSGDKGRETLNLTQIKDLNSKRMPDRKNCGVINLLSSCAAVRV